MFPFMLEALTLQAQEIVTSQTVWEFLSSGGPVMIPIGICSVVMVAFAIERLLYLKKERVVPDDLKNALDLLHSGQPEQALSYTEKLDVPAGRILAAGIRRRGQSLHDIERVMEDQGHKEMERLRHNIRPLNVVANVAPLLGLLGTVIGIQESFHHVVKSGLGKPEHLAGGIEEALVTTIAGLSVAIPSLLIAAHLTAKARRLLTDADEQISPVIDLLAAQPASKREESDAS